MKTVRDSFPPTRKAKGFLWYYFMHEQVLRYLTTIHRREEPFWYFFAVLPVGLFPWVTFLPQAVKHAFTGGWKKRSEQPEVFFFAIWIAFVLLFFSTSQSKLIPYILPVYPALALLVGRYLAAGWENPGNISLKAGYLAYGIIAVLLAVAAPVILHSRAAATPVRALPLFGLLIGILAISAILMFWFCRGKSSPRGLIAMMLATAGICFVFNPLAVAMHRPSTKLFCSFLKPRLAQGAVVFSLRGYFQDMPPYLGSLVAVVDYMPDEQKFGLQLENHSNRYLEVEAFFEVWRGEKRVYALTAWPHYKTFADSNPSWQKFVIMKDDNFVLFSNRPEPYNPDPVKP